jgi:predicted O-methyltransferase YrrM
MYQIKRFNIKYKILDKSVEYKISNEEEKELLNDKTNKIKKILREKGKYKFGYGPLFEILYVKYEKRLKHVLNFNEDLDIIYYPIMPDFTENEKDYNLANSYKCSGDKKYDEIYANTINYSLAKKDIDMKQKIKIEFPYLVEKIRSLFKCLKKDGKFLTSFLYGFDSNNIKLLHILLLLFKKIILIHNKIYCYDFNPKINISEYDKLINNISNLEIKRIINLDDLSRHQINYYKLLYDIYKSFDEEKWEIFTEKLYNYYLRSIPKYNKNDPIELYLFEKFNVNTVSGEKLVTPIKSPEGDFIRKLISKNKLNKCLEIGMEHGIITMYILLALQDIKNKNKQLISIDPYQSTQWSNYGINLVKSIGLGKYHKLLENKTTNILPKMLENKDKFDFIIINNWHTFDTSVLEFYYSSLILNTNGYIIIMNILYPGLNKLVKYLENNYKHFMRIYPAPNDFAVFQKLKEDDRDNNFYVNF